MLQGIGLIYILLKLCKIHDPLLHLEIFLLDGIETHNGEAVYLIPGVTPKSANQRALLFYYQTLAWHLKAITTSDGHSVREIGSSWMRIPKLDVNDLANSLRGSILHDNESDLRYREEHNSYLGLATHIGALGIDALARKLRR